MMICVTLNKKNTNILNLNIKNFKNYLKKKTNIQEQEIKLSKKRNDRCITLDTTFIQLQHFFSN
jgi:hypothetical protein